MQWKLCLLLVQLVMLGNEFGRTWGKALIGEGVRQVERKEFRFVVPLVKTLDPDQSSLSQRFCTGALITQKDVLTAAHCLRRVPESRIRILVGSRDMRDSVRYYIHWTRSYEQWTQLRGIPLEFERNDIALIRLTSRIPREIRPARITSLSNAELYGLDVWLAGWGRKLDGDIPYIMETAQVKIYPNQMCEQRAFELSGQQHEFHQRFLCSFQQPYVVLSFGDSGGPVIYNNTVVGVSSGACLYQDQEFNPNKLNLHLGIEYYRMFIHDTITS